MSLSQALNQFAQNLGRYPATSLICVHGIWRNVSDDGIN